jgi:hypothetical protein
MYVLLFHQSYVNAFILAFLCMLLASALRACADDLLSAIKTDKN